MCRRNRAICTDSAQGARRLFITARTGAEIVTNVLFRCDTSPPSVAGHVRGPPSAPRPNRRGPRSRSPRAARLRVVARNHRTRWGEIDLVVHDGTVLVFVEVKTRRASGRGGPWEALRERKRAQVRRMAAAYLADVQDRPRSTDLRFDAIGVVIDPRGRLVRLDHLEGAF